MESKYTADDLVEALKYLENDITFGEFEEFLYSLNLDVELVDANDALCKLGAEKFLDEYNEYFNKLTIEDLEIGDIITDGERTLVVLSKDTYTMYCLSSDDAICRISSATIPLYIKATNLTLNYTINSIKDALKAVEEASKKGE